MKCVNKFRRNCSYDLERSYDLQRFTFSYKSIDTFHPFSSDFNILNAATAWFWANVYRTLNRRVSVYQDQTQTKGCVWQTKLFRRPSSQVMFLSSVSTFEAISYPMFLFERSRSRSSRYKHQISSILRKNIITRNFHLLRDDPDRAAIFQPLRILSAYRRHNNLRDSLVRSTLNGTTPTSEDRGTFPCGRSRCNTCEKRKSVKSTAKTLKHSGDRKFRRKKQNRKQENTEENSRRNHGLRKKSCQIHQAKPEPRETPRIRQK